MKVLQRLTEFDNHQLNQLEQNARKLLNGATDSDAKTVLSAVAEERLRRTDMTRLAKAAEADAIRKRMLGTKLSDRIATAFAELPPLDWERAALRALGDHPGATTEELSKALGYSETYMNLFGQVCRDREPWLGSASPGPDGRTIYSSVLVDFVERVEPDTGRKVTGWWLKPEALAGLRSLSLVG